MGQTNILKFWSRAQNTLALCFVSGLLAVLEVSGAEPVASPSPSPPLLLLLPPTPTPTPSPSPSPTPSPTPTPTPSPSPALEAEPMLETPLTPADLERTVPLPRSRRTSVRGFRDESSLYAPIPEEGEHAYQPQTSEEFRSFYAQEWTPTLPYQAQTRGESLFDSLNQVPSPDNLLIPLPSGPGGYKFHFGPVNFQPILSAGANYQRTTDISGVDNGASATFSPALAIQIGEAGTGKTLQMFYGANLQVPSRDNNFFNQYLSLVGQLDFSKISLGLGISFTALSGLNRDFGGDVQRDLLNISLTSAYRYSQKTSFSNVISFPIRRFSGGISSESVVDSLFVDYAYSPKTTVGAGVTAGLVRVENASTQKYASVNLRMSYLPSAKISFRTTIGAQVRDGGDTSKIKPVFALGVGWRARERTFVELSGQTLIVNASSIAGANYTTTGLQLSVSQQIGNSVTAFVSAGFEYAPYNSVVQSVSTNREDITFTLQGGISKVIARRWAPSLNLSWGDVKSNTQPFQFFQASLQVSYLF